MNLFDLGEPLDNLSTESSPFHHNNVARAIEKQARNASVSNGISKKDDDDFAREHDERIAHDEERKSREESEKAERAENRKEALKDLGEGLIEAAKATGKGVKETSRIAYNLALGKRFQWDN